MVKIITRIKGGIGNQLFCYAAARRLALVNNAELIIDNATGFSRDVQYRRKYALDAFQIPARKATPKERMEPFERYRRGMMKMVSRWKPFSKRHYLEQEGRDFDRRLLDLKVQGTLYLDGLWQSEGYFKDVEQIIREDLQIIPPKDVHNHYMAEEIRNNNSIALHVRWFDMPGNTGTHNVSTEYYQRAVALMEKEIKSPHYFLFSDAPEAAILKLTLPKDRVTLVSDNRGDDNAYADLWLMSQCRHFIIANSTFSWWGAWLGGGDKKIVMAPDLNLDGKTAWGFKGLIPNSWLRI